MNRPNLNITINAKRALSRMLLLAALVAPLAAARATEWSFNLVGAPSALFDESPTGESISLTGACTFDPDKGMVQASGAVTVLNAADHPAPPLGTTLKGTWHATGFVSFIPGMLIISVHFDLALGAEQPNALLIVTEDGIQVTNFGPDKEEYTTMLGGSAQFHLHGKAEAP